MNKCIPYGGVIITEELDACAIWVPPRVWVEAPLSLDYIRMLPKILRRTDLGRLRRYLEVDKLEYSKRPQECHFYLVFLGVHPDTKEKDWAPIY